jgi:hypothetical protein
MKITPIKKHIEPVITAETQNEQTLAPNGEKNLHVNDKGDPSVHHPQHKFETFDLHKFPAKETHWPNELQRVFQRFHIEPPVLLQIQIPHGYYDKTYPVKRRTPNALPGAVLVQGPFLSELQKKWIMVHEIGHALEDRCMPIDWAKLVDQTRRNRILKRINKGHYDYNLQPNECWAYAVTQYLAKDESWLKEYVFGSSKAAQATRYFSTIPHGLFPLLPHWDPADFLQLMPVMKCAMQKVGIHQNIEVDIS